MSKTSIEWTDRTWNPTRGCSRVSAGCTRCYAERQAARFARAGVHEDWPDGTQPGPFHGFVTKINGHASWTGKVELIESKLLEPLSWRTPARIFVNSMSDLFHEELPDEVIDSVFAVMALCPQHTFQILTKRHQRMMKWSSRKFIAGDVQIHVNDLRDIHRVQDAFLLRLAATKGGLEFLKLPQCEQDEIMANSTDTDSWPLPNVHLGVSVEDQQTADERIPLLLQTPAAKHFVSYEPALGPVDFEYPESLYGKDGPLMCCGAYDCGCQGKPVEPPLIYGIDQIIVGGESGPGARPFDIAWARQTIQQCKAAGVAVFYKQGGLSNACKHDRKGGHLECFPEDLQIRELI